MTINSKWRRGQEEAPGLSKGLTSDDAAVINCALPWLYMVSPTVNANAQLRYGTFAEPVAGDDDDAKFIDFLSELARSDRKRGTALRRGSATPF